MTWLTENTLVFGTWGVLAAVLLLPALEAALPLIGVLLPGQTAVVMGGVLAHHGRVPLGWIVVTALLGAVLGNGLGYAAGRRWNTRASGTSTYGSPCCPRCAASARGSTSSSPS